MAGMSAAARTGRRLRGAGLSLLLGGVANALTWLAPLVHQTDTTVTGQYVSVVTAPSDHHSTLQHGSYLVMQMQDGSPRIQPDHLRVTGPSGAVVTVRQAHGHRTLMADGQNYSDAASFHIDEPGDYEIYLALPFDARVIVVENEADRPAIEDPNQLGSTVASVAVGALLLMIGIGRSRRAYPQVGQQAAGEPPPAKTVPIYGNDPHRLTLTLIRLMRSRSDEWLAVPNPYRPTSNKYRERVARAALLLDWAATGRLSSGITAFEIDTNPSGNPGADALLAAIERRPDLPLEQWLSADVPVMAGLVEGLCAQGVWVRFRRPLLRRYRDERPAEMVALQAALDAVEQGGESEPEMIALAMLDLLVTQYPVVIPSWLITEYRCRELTWIIRIVRDYFEQELPKFARGQYFSTSTY